MTTFIGVDLAWQGDKNHSGVAAFAGDARRVACAALSSGITTLEAVHAFIAQHESADTVVAIDAPLVVENAHGQRACEREVTRRFGRFHAGAHASNRSLYPSPGGAVLASALVSRGYRHCSDPRLAFSRAGRWFFEVYPHPAHVVLFERSRIIKYKKGPVGERRLGLAELRDEIGARIFGPGAPFALDPALGAFLATDLGALRGKALKHHEDVLDAILCAYLAFHLWHSGWERSEMIGDLAAGYIVVPTAALPRAAAAPSPAARSVRV